MSERFEGRDGKRKLIEVLADQKIVQHNDAIARKLADMVRVVEFPETKQLYVRGEPGKNCMFFVLSGSIDLSIQDKHVATLERGQFIGEFPILCASLDYAVTVIAREKSVVASLSEQQFLSLAGDYPEIWRNISKELANRLRAANTARQREASVAINPKDLTILTILKDLTLPQVCKIIATIFVVLSMIASGAYAIGTIKLFG